LNRFYKTLRIKENVDMANVTYFAHT
jgi:hypothetical protein